MPIYEFVCEACGRLVERLQKVTDPPPDGCPECSGKMAKIMSRNSFQLKGGGWYKDLYSSSKGGGANSTSGTSAPSSDAGAASTPSPSTGGAPPASAPAPATPPPPATKKD
jgi:putative FmdB family regulatory protein